MKNKIWWNVLKKLILAILILLCINIGASSAQEPPGSGTPVTVADKGMR